MTSLGSLSELLRLVGGVWGAMGLRRLGRYSHVRSGFTRSLLGTGFRCVLTVRRKA